MVLTRKRMSLATWRALSNEDKEHEMAWELHLQRRLDEWMDVLESNEKGTPEAMTLVVLAKSGLL